jgi:hypothetical protein
MSSKRLTLTEGYALTDKRIAVRLSSETLMTRTALYEWSDPDERWQRTHNRLRIVHSRGRDGRGWRWDPQQ